MQISRLVLLSERIRKTTRTKVMFYRTLKVDSKFLNERENIKTGKIKGKPEAYR